MINQNQIIENVKTIQSNSTSTLNSRSIIKSVYEDSENTMIKEVVYSLLKVCIKKSEKNDLLIRFLNQSIPGQDNSTLWEDLLKSFRCISSYQQLDSMRWSDTDDYWESTFIFSGSPIELVSRLKLLPVFKFESYNFYFDTKHKFGFISSTGDKWFIKKSCNGYFEVFTHYLNAFKKHIEDGNKFYTNLVEQQGHKTLTCRGNLLEEHWDNDLYFDLAPELNLVEILESFGQIKKLNSEVRLKINDLSVFPYYKYGGFINLTDLDKAISQLSGVIEQYSCL